MHKIDFYNRIWGCPKSNERYTKCGGFDKLNHRNTNLLDSSPVRKRLSKRYTKCGGFDKLNHRNANLLDSLYLRMYLTASLVILKC